MLLKRKWYILAVISFFKVWVSLWIFNYFSHERMEGESALEVIKYGSDL